MARSKRDIAMLIIALVGLAFSLYSVTLHYSPTSDSICNINETFNCDKVNKSPWAVFLGIPVAILGAMSYLFVFLIALKKRAVKRWLSFEDGDFNQYFLLLAGAMLCFQLYLTYAEVFLIRAYCIACLVSQVCTMLLAVLAWKEFRKK